MTCYLYSPTFLKILSPLKNSWRGKQSVCTYIGGVTVNGDKWFWGWEMWNKYLQQVRITVFCGFYFCSGEGRGLYKIHFLGSLFHLLVCLLHFCNTGWDSISLRYRHQGQQSMGAKLAKRTPQGLTRPTESWLTMLACTLWPSPTVSCLAGMDWGQLMISFSLPLLSPSLSVSICS